MASLKHVLKLAHHWENFTEKQYSCKNIKYHKEKPSDIFSFNIQSSFFQHKQKHGKMKNYILKIITSVKYMSYVQLWFGINLFV